VTTFWTMPPGDSMAAKEDIKIGDLVKVHGLQSARGKQLNDRFGEIVPTENDDGRLGVRLYTQLQDGRQVAVTSLGQGTEEVAVKSEHLLRHDQNCTEFLAYLGAKAVGHMQRRELDVALPIMRRYLQRQPGDIGMWATLANVLRETGQMSQSIEILRNILDNPLPPSMAPNKHKFQYDLSAALEKSGDLAGAFEVCTAIQTGSQGAPHAREAAELKIELLRKLTSSSKKVPQTAQAMEFGEQVSRALLELTPDDGPALWDLGAVLCRRGECAEGLAFYEGALKKGVGLSAAQRHKLTGIIAVTQKQVRGDISGAVVGVTDDGEVVTVQGVPGVDFVHTMNAGGEGQHSVQALKTDGVAMSVPASALRGKTETQS